MKTLVEMKFGSHLYGTATPSSDLDYKSVFVPSYRDIILSRVKPVIVINTNNSSSRNTADDVDRESFSLQKYLQLVSEGQTVALDMLFAPNWALIGFTDDLWREIQNNKHRLVTSQYTSFVGYCRTQANRYGIRGSRVASVRAALDLLESLARLESNMKRKLGEFSELIEPMAASQEYQAILPLQTPSLDPEPRYLNHWEVCGRKLPYTITVKEAHVILSRIFENYGHRALAAEKNDGVDWKSLSHAVRIAEQAIELLETGQVVFPRRNAEYLRAIKLGELDYKVVAAEIEDLLERVEEAASKSTLPKEPDRAWIDDLVFNTYSTASKNF